MNHRRRQGWSRHIDQVIRSKHYTWLGEGLGGETLPEALSCMITDIMHICRRQGISFDDLLAAGEARFAQEERDDSKLVEAG